MCVCIFQLRVIFECRERKCGEQKRVCLGCFLGLSPRGYK